MSQIIIQDGHVIKDGKEVGTIGADGAFYPSPGLHHKTIEAVNKFLNQPQGETVSSDVHNVASEGSTPSPATIEGKFDPKGVTIFENPHGFKSPPEIDFEPPQDPQSGDKTPAYVEWYARNHTKAEFDAKYPPSRKLNRPQ